MDAARDEIVDLLLRYARAVDTKDWALLASCFVDDVEADYGVIGSWRDAGSLVAFMEEAHAGMGPTQHRLTNFAVEVDGDRATSSTYVHSVTVLASGPDDWIDTIGAYDDEFVGGPGGWRISRRCFTVTRMLVSPSLGPAPWRVQGT